MKVSTCRPTLMRDLSTKTARPPVVFCLTTLLLAWSNSVRNECIPTMIGFINFWSDASVHYRDRRRADAAGPRFRGPVTPLRSRSRLVRRYHGKQFPADRRKWSEAPPPRRTVGPRASLLRRPIDGGPSRVGCHPAAGSRSGSLLSTVRLARRVEVGAVRQAMDSLYYSRQATRCRRRLSRDDVLLAIRFAVGGTKSLFDPASTRTVFRRAV